MNNYKITLITVNYSAFTVFTAKIRFIDFAVTIWQYSSL
jgi:hypothetical protein